MTPAGNPLNPTASLFKQTEPPQTDRNNYDCKGADESRASTARSPIGKGKSGATLTVWFGGASNSATPVFSAPVYSSMLEGLNPKVKTGLLFIYVPAAECARNEAARIAFAGRAFCAGRIVWNAAIQGFVAQHETKRSTFGMWAQQLFEGGKIVPGNAAEAERLWTVAADEGDLESMHQLAGIYAFGTGVGQDAARAVALWRRVAEAGDLADMYGTGDSLSSQAMFRLYMVYNSGAYRGVDRDPVQAAYWLDRHKQATDFRTTRLVNHRDNNMCAGRPTDHACVQPAASERICPC
jgi:hypothetical protein